MGTDINMIAEVRRNGVWELSTAKVFKNPWYDQDSDKKWAMDEYVSKPDSSRNYDLLLFLQELEMVKDLPDAESVNGLSRLLS